MKDDVQTMLEQRGDRYGNVDDQAKLYDDLIEVTGRRHNYWSELTPRQRMCLRMICLKVSRIITGDHGDPDTWKDIEGYARLAVKGPTSSDGGLTNVARRGAD